MAPLFVVSTVAASVPTYAARKNRVSGNLTLNSTTWADVDTGLDIVLSAKTGDWCEVGFSGGADIDNLTGTYLDVVTLVSAAPVNSLADAATPDNAHNGIQAWWLTPAPIEGASSSVPLVSGGSLYYKLLAGDIAAGTVTLRLRYRTGSAGNHTLFGNTNQPLTFWARNHG